MTRAVNNNKNQFAGNIYHTWISLLLSISAIAILFILGLLHINDVDEFGEAWGKFALLQGVLGLVGLIGNFTLSLNFKIVQFDPEKMIFAVIGAIALLALQIFASLSLSVSSTEKMLYYLFSAVCEELFFRGFLMYLFIKISKKNYIILIIGIVIQALSFMMLHQNYYGHPEKLLVVFISGAILGILFVYKRDITVNIIAHFIVNAIAVGQMLVYL